MSETNVASVIIGYLIVSCLYAIGLYLHIKIILVSKREKDMSWKIDITNSLLLMITYTFCMFMHTITDIIEDLHSYTSEWFCYAYLIMLHYSLLLYIPSHSTVISMMKYIVIVYEENIRDFGKEKIIELFFWINLFHPILDITLRSIIRPDFWSVALHSGWYILVGEDNFLGEDFTQDDNCLGFARVCTSCKTTTLHDLCDFPKPMLQDYTLYIFKRSICWVQTVIMYANSWQLFDVFFYCRIFAYARR